MWIAGWQKLSLVDYPDKVACTLFTGGCNLRCPYCHNSELVAGNFPRVDENEITSYLDKRQNILDGVVISGGEPCMQPDLLPFLRELKKRQLLIKLDTNGVTLPYWKRFYRKIWQTMWLWILKRPHRITP